MTSIPIIHSPNLHLSKGQLGVHIKNQTLQPLTSMQLQQMTINFPKICICEKSAISHHSHDHTTTLCFATDQHEHFDVV